MNGVQEWAWVGARGFHPSAVLEEALRLLSSGEVALAEWLKILDIIENADTLLKIDCIRFDELSETNALKKSITREGVSLFRRESNVSKPH